jgi:hypothetical protein
MLPPLCATAGTARAETTGLQLGWSAGQTLLESTVWAAPAAESEAEEAGMSGSELALAPGSEVQGLGQEIEAGTLACCPAVGLLRLNRPQRANAFNAAMWRDFPQVRAAFVK